MITAMAIAQMISEYGLFPNTWLMAPTCGVSSGKPLEMVRVIPVNMKRVPSVVMKDGTFSSTVTKPLNSPTDALTSRPKIMPTHIGRPAWLVKYIMKGASA